MATHKRYAQSDRDLTFARPRVECFACYDTGIIANGDGLLSRFLPDYDTIPNGSRMTGSDTAIICHCTASYDRLEPDGKVASKGCREGSGDIRAITTESGPRIYGSEIPKEHSREIHKIRLQSWKETEAAMSQARIDRANGNPDAAPWYVAELRSQLQSLTGAAGSRLTNPFASIAPPPAEGASEGHAAQAQSLTPSQLRARALVREYDERIAADPTAFDVA